MRTQGIQERNLLQNSGAAASSVRAKTAAVHSRIDPLPLLPLLHHSCCHFIIVQQDPHGGGNLRGNLRGFRGFMCQHRSRAVWRFEFAEHPSGNLAGAQVQTMCGSGELGAQSVHNLSKTVRVKSQVCQLRAPWQGFPQSRLQNPSWAGLFCELPRLVDEGASACQAAGHRVVSCDGGHEYILWRSRDASYVSCVFLGPETALKR